jgi:Putative serine esterase (DUF676)
MKTLKALILMGVSILSLIACGDSSPPLPAVTSNILVGQIENSDALIAIVRDENSFAAYVCGGTNTWQTHTGWFRSSAPEKQGNNLESSSGLKFSADFADQTAKGTVTLKDGTKLNWSAETATGAAGLFIREDADVLTGLILDNKGNTAGTARTSNNAGGFSSSPVQVSTAIQPGANTVTGVAAVNGSNANLELLRTLNPSAIVVVINPIAVVPSPTILVLVHGATNQFSAPGAKEMALDGTPGTRRHARLFWTEPFVDGLLNGAKPNPLVTLTGTDISGSSFYTRALPTEPNTVPEASACDLNDFITTQSRLISATKPPELSVMLTHRNAGLSLVDQVVNASIQIQSCLDIFKTTYNRTAKLVFVAHSMGGLVSRFLLSRPSTSAVQQQINANVLTTPLSGTLDRYTNSAFTKMDFIRNRTAYAVTLATPHEGSRLADQLAPIRAKLVSLRAWLQSNTLTPSTFGLGVADVQLALKIASAAYLNSGFSIPDTSSVDISAISGVIFAWLKNPQSKLIATLNTTIRGIDGMNANAVKDLDSATLQGLNTSILEPKLMARGADSPIPDASNRLIPIHVAGARSAGGEVYDTLHLNKIFSSLKAYNELMPTFEGESRAVGYIRQAMMAQAALDAIAGPKIATDRRLDARKYTDWLSEVTTLTETAVGASFPRSLNFWRYAKAQVNTPVNTAIANYILTKIITGTGTPKTPVYLKNKWLVDFQGQETVNVPALICRVGTGPVLATITIDLDLFLRFLIKGGRTFEDGLATINSSSFANFLSNLGNLGTDFVNLLADLKAFLNEKRTELGNLPEDCTGPIDTLTNWEFTSVSQTVSAPRLIETNELNSDDAVENDSLVEYDSAMGYKLGTTTRDFFDHTRSDFSEGNKHGSWYRFYSSGLEPFNHDIMHKTVGLWISKTFIDTDTGPFVCATGTKSSTTVCN